MHCSSCGVSVAEGTAFCGSCGRPILGFSIAPLAEGSSVGGAIAAPAGMVAVQATNYAGFWLRFVAAFIDGIILGIPLSLIAFLLIASAIPELTHTQDPMTIIISILPRIMILLVIYLIV
jgi:hypothetical protein